MKVHLVTNIIISATSPNVFRYLAYTKNHYLWNPHLRTVAPMRLKLGMNYKSSSLLLGVTVKADNTVTKYVPNKEIELENNTGAVQYNVNYRLVSAQSNTLLTCTTTVSSNSNAFVFSTPLIMKLLAKRELHTDLEALKIAVEQKL